MSFLKEALIILIVAVLFVIGFSAYACFIYARPRRFVSSATPESFGFTYFENVTFVTSDGLALKGWYIPSKIQTDKAIVICHGYPMDKGNVLVFAKIFHDDYNVLLFDFRGMGESNGFFTTLGYNEAKDLEAAVSHLQGRGIKKIGALGFSLGGAVIISANNPYISAIVSDSAYAELEMMLDHVYKNFFIFKRPFIYCTNLMAKLVIGIDISKISPLKAAKNLKAPVLLIHSEEDTQVDVKSAYLLHRTCPNSELWVVPAADHGVIYYIYEDEYKKRILTFFKKHL